MAFSPESFPLGGTPGHPVLLMEYSISCCWRGCHFASGTIKELLMDFYSNIHKGRGDKGSSIIAYSDPVVTHAHTLPPPPSSTIIHPGESKFHHRRSLVLMQPGHKRPDTGEKGFPCIICWKCLSLLLR